MPTYEIKRANGTTDIIVSDSEEGARRDAGPGSEVTELSPEDLAQRSEDAQRELEKSVESNRDIDGDGVPGDDSEPEAVGPFGTDDPNSAEARATAANYNDAQGNRRDAHIRTDDDFANVSTDPQPPDRPEALDSPGIDSNSNPADPPITPARQPVRDLTATEPVEPTE